MDLSSQALSVWQNALRRDPTGKLRKLIEELPGVVYSTKPLAADGVGFGPEGVLVYVRTPQGTDALAWLDRHGRSVTESPLANRLVPKYFLFVFSGASSRYHRPGPGAGQ